MSNLFDLPIGFVSIAASPKSKRNRFWLTDCVDAAITTLCMNYEGPQSLLMVLIWFGKLNEIQENGFKKNSFRLKGTGSETANSFSSVISSRINNQFNTVWNESNRGIPTFYFTLFASLQLVGSAPGTSVFIFFLILVSLR